MEIKMTNPKITPDQLNYNHYPSEAYDTDVQTAVIPGHKELHDCIAAIVQKEFEGKKPRVLELGPGTGLTSLRVFESAHVSEYVSIDFSEHMLDGAQKRLQGYNPTFILADYSEIQFQGKFDLVVSAISIHHQTNEGKRDLFHKIIDALSLGGIFLLGDLVTYRDPYEAALNEAYQHAHLVANARDEQALKEWSHHYKFVNILAPLEDQVEWLSSAGFKEIKVPFRKYNTALIYARK